MSYPQRLYSVRLFLSKQGTFTRIFDVIYEETPDPAFTGTGVSQLMTFFTAPSFSFLLYCLTLVDRVHRSFSQSPVSLDRYHIQEV